MEHLVQLTANQEIFVLTGAGISKESGIKTFRDQDGLWNNHRVEDVATPEAFYRNPSLVYDFYNKRRKELNSGIKPNKAHIILAELEKTLKINIITQNIDNWQKTFKNVSKTCQIKLNFIFLINEITYLFVYDSSCSFIWNYIYPLFSFPRIKSGSPHH